MIIILFGPDGSGKTTLARALALFLMRRGFKVRVSWMRGTHTLASLLARLLSNFKTFGGLDNPYYRISIPPRLRRLWQLIEFISVMPVVFSHFILPSLLGYVVIGDRYLPDFIVWVAVTTRDPKYPTYPEARLLLALSRRVTAIYVTASRDVILSRRGWEPMLNAQLPMYEAVAKALDAYRVDTTSRSIPASLKEVLAALGLWG